MVVGKIKWLFAGFFLLLCIAGASFWVIRNQLISTILPAKIQSAEKKTGFQIRYAGAEIAGFSGIRFDSLQIEQKEKQIFLQFYQLTIQISPLSVLAGNLSVQSVQMDSVTGHKFVLEQTEGSEQTDSLPKTEWTSWMQRQFQRMESLLGNVPPSIQIPYLRLQTGKPDSLLTIECTDLRAENRKLRSKLRWVQGGISQEADITSVFDADQFAVSVSAPAGKELSFQPRQGSLRFQTLEASAEWKQTAEKTTCKGSLLCKGLTVFQKRLSKEEVQFPETKIEFQVQVSDRAIEIDSVTKVQLGKLPITVYAKADWKQDTILEVKCAAPLLPAMQYIEAIPLNFCSKISELQLDGSWQWNFFLKMNLSKPEEDQYYADLKPEGIQIRSNPYPNLLSLDSAFTYQPYNASRTLRMGKGFSAFTPIDSISSILQNCVLEAEDGTFYYHKGFLEKGFLLAIRDNLRSGAFKRGGSTISMQFVKNVFLTHQKTLGRKLEEAMLVWLIENLKLTSKKRMFELYLNLIEWGPDVYGITEAANFYFNKKPSQLDLNESIFLALIIPKPRYFSWYFTDNGELKDITVQYYAFLTSHLLRNKRITQAEFDQLIPNIRLAPKAIQKLKIKMNPIPEEGEEPLLPSLPVIQMETF